MRVKRNLPIILGWEIFYSIELMRGKGVFDAEPKEDDSSLDAIRMSR